MHQLPNSSKNCLSIGLHKWIQMCGLQCSKGNRRKSSLVSLSTGLNVYMIYIFSAEFSLTCGLNCTENTRLIGNVPANSGCPLLHDIHANCTTKPQLVFLGLLSQQSPSAFVSVISPTSQQLHLNSYIYSIQYSKMEV